MSLQDEIDNTRSQMHTDSYAMSIGELISIYERNELDVHPEFQRLYRWTDTQKTRLIESVLLGIPIPPIFVSQRPDGVWDVVDGVQRLSTLFQLAGVLRDAENTPLPPLQLLKTRHLPSLAGKVWGDAHGTGQSLTMAQRLAIKRAKLDIVIVLKESDESGKFELFQRLNGGGTALTDQEMRNCIMVMQDATFYEYVRSLADSAPFLEAVSLSDKNIQEQYHMELALRFLLLRSIAADQLTNIGDMGDFLTDQMLVALADLDRAGEKAAFTSTFDVLCHAGAQVFRRYDGAFKGGFLVSAFEAVALGVGHHAAKGCLKPADIVERAQGLWSNEVFTKFSGSGVRASSRIPKVIPLGRKLFAP